MDYSKLKFGLEEMVRVSRKMKEAGNEQEAADIKKAFLLIYSGLQWSNMHIEKQTLIDIIEQSEEERSF